MVEAYFIAKWLHILSSTVLFGTGIGTAFQMFWAMRTGRLETIHSVSSGVVIADWIFTTPAGIVQPLTGLWLIYLQGHAWNEPWLMATYGLYAVAFICWAPVVRLQIQIRDLSGIALAEGAALPEATRKAFRIWFALGWPALAALAIVFWLMVTKPALW